MKIQKHILNSNPYISVNVIENTKDFDYTLQIDNQVIESENQFSDLEELVDDLKENLAYELSAKYPDNEELFSDDFIEKLDAIN